MLLDDDDDGIRMSQVACIASVRRAVVVSVLKTSRPVTDAWSCATTASTYMQAVHNAPNEMRRHLDSGGASGGKANGVSHNIIAQSQPLPPGTSKGYYFNVSTACITCKTAGRWHACSRNM
jgi:hypothetical protein